MLEYSVLFLDHHISFSLDSRKDYLGIAWVRIYLQHTRSTMYNHRNCAYNRQRTDYNSWALVGLADSTRWTPRRLPQTRNWPKTSFLKYALLQDMNFRTWTGILPEILSQLGLFIFWLNWLKVVSYSINKGITERDWNTCFALVKMVKIEWHRWESWRQRYIDVMDICGYPRL